MRLRDRFTRRGMRYQLWALFAMFLLAGAAVLVIDEVARYQARQSLQALRDESLQRMRLLKSVSDAYGLDVVDTTFRVRNALVSWDTGVETLDGATARIEADWARLAAMPRTAEQQELFAQTERARVRADRAADSLRVILVARDIDALGRFADVELYPAIDPVTHRLQRLADLALADAEVAVARDLARSKRVSLMRVGLSLLALVLIALLGRVVLRNAYRGVESLTWLVRRMRDHDFTAVPAHHPRGELGTVMDAFLDMRRDVLAFETELTDQLMRNEATRAELTRREAFQRSLLDAAQVAILAIDAHGRWSVVNPFAEALLGWRADEMLGRVVRYGGATRDDDGPMLVTAEQVEHTAARLSQRLGREVPTDWRVLVALAELRRPPAEAVLRHRDGHDVPVLLALSALQDDDGEHAGVIVAAADLSPLKQLEGELRASEARAQAANEAKSQFLAAMSHEIRTPMIGVTGMIEVLAHTRLDGEQRHALNVIQQSSQSLLQILGDILDFSKIEAGRLDLAPVVVSLPALLRSTVANYAGAASSQGLALNCTIGPDVAPAHRVDPLRVRQIVANFLSNAIKFTREGSVEVALDSHGPVPDGSVLGAQRLEVRVTDTGIGVSAEQQQRLFQAFSQADGDTTRRFGGTGLGLVICRRLAELMGGEVTMESVPGVGTTMRLVLTVPRARAEELPVEPVDAAPASPALVPRPLPAVDQAERERSLVLLVDDHPINRLVIGRQLSLAGYASESADDGAAALERWRSGRYALVLSDVHMPGLDGYGLAQAIRAEEAAGGRPRTPIVALTAAAMKGEAERCLAAGMDDYLPKPVPVATLAACLQRWLPHTAPAAGGTGVAADAGAPMPQLDAATALDPAVLDAISGGDAATAAAVLDEYLEATAADLRELAAARDAGDAARMAREAHKIKGAARLVGATEIAATALTLELRAHDGELAALLPLVADVELAAERLRLLVARRAR